MESKFPSKLRTYNTSCNSIPNTTNLNRNRKLKVFRSAACEVSSDTNNQGNMSFLRSMRSVSRSLSPGVRIPCNVTSSAHYHEKVIDHYENPRNVGSLDKNDKNVGTGLVGAPACGDVMKLQIKVDDEGKIIDAKFKTFGCGSAIASSSLATEWVKGKSVDEALKIKNSDIAKELRLPPVKLHCSMLAEDAIKAALKDYIVKRDVA